MGPIQSPDGNHRRRGRARPAPARGSPSAPRRADRRRSAAPRSSATTGAASGFAVVPGGQVDRPHLGPAPARRRRRRAPRSTGSRPPPTARPRTRGPGRLVRDGGRARRPRCAGHRPAAGTVALDLALLGGVGLPTPGPQRTFAGSSRPPARTDDAATVDEVAARREAEAPSPPRGLAVATRRSGARPAPSPGRQRSPPRAGRAPRAAARPRRVPGLEVEGPRAAGGGAGPSPRRGPRSSLKRCELPGEQPGAAVREGDREVLGPSTSTRRSAASATGGRRTPRAAAARRLRGGRRRRLGARPGSAGGERAPAWPACRGGRGGGGKRSCRRSSTSRDRATARSRRRSSIGVS